MEYYLNIGKTCTTFTLIAWILTIFVGCKPRGQSPAHTPPASMTQGTADSGGGNTFNGKPLESYIVDITLLPAFKNQVEPILEDLKYFSVGNYAFQFLIKNKAWYFIPEDLTTLPKEKIGSAVHSEQAALQDFKQIWINSKIFDAMTSEEDQAKLILHELLMGLKLLKFDSARQECLGYSVSPESSHLECGYFSESARGKPSDLKEKDYAQIRASVDEIFSRHKELFDKSGEWEDIFFRHGYSSSYIRFSKFATNKTITLADVNTIISQAKMIGINTPNGYDINELSNNHPNFIKSNLSSSENFIWKPSYTCKVSLEFNIDTVSALLETNRGKVNTKFKISNYGLETWDIQDFDGEWFTSLHLRPDFRGLSNQKGQRYFKVNLNLLDKEIQTIIFNEYICLNDNCSEYARSSQSSDFWCSSKKSLKFLGLN